jgi:methylenetetrahydrofolate dehydrogenase (NADP+)/methenyltetrahydrofolate cyclohydrolase
MTAQVIDGTKIAEALKRDVMGEVADLARDGIRCGLATLAVGDDYTAGLYERRIASTAADLQVPHLHVELPADASQHDVRAAVEALNADPTISGVLILRPLPDHIDEVELFCALAPHKDIDAVHPENAGLLALGSPRFVPPTAASAFHVLDRWIDETGQDRDDFYHSSLIVVVGRSSNVGKPSVLLALQRQASVESVDEWATRNGQLGWHTRRADVLIVAAGSPELICAEHVREGTVVLDVGINPVHDPSGVHIVGDVNFTQVRARAYALTPVPGGIGPVTDVWLIRNVVAAARIGACLPAAHRA